MELSISILNAVSRIESVKKLNRTNIQYIHVDIMDGNFVPDIQFNKIEEIVEIDLSSHKKLDIHLMVENPIKYIEQLNNLNIEYITFHLELNKNINEIISKIREKKYKVGISIKPDTKVEELVPYLGLIDLVLIMSVEPGKGGQNFIVTTTNKIKELKQLIKKYNNNIKIEVDGGINNKTISLLDNVDIAVVGSYIVKSNNYPFQIKKLLKNIDAQ